MYCRTFPVRLQRTALARGLCLLLLRNGAAVEESDQRKDPRKE
jgi:hypothetical protein